MTFQIIFWRRDLYGRRTDEEEETEVQDAYDELGGAWERKIVWTHHCFDKVRVRSCGHTTASTRYV
jgi:hypothetical protein